MILNQKIFMKLFLSLLFKHIRIKLYCKMICLFYIICVGLILDILAFIVTKSNFITTILIYVFILISALIFALFLREKDKAVYK